MDVDTKGIMKRPLNICACCIVHSDYLMDRNFCYAVSVQR